MPRTSTLPQFSGAPLLTDSGIETDIIFGAGRDLPAFAVFPLLDDPEGREVLRAYYQRHLAIAARLGLGYVLETPTWRSNPDWGRSLGYSQDALDGSDRRAVTFMREMRDEAGVGLGPSPISGLIGPRGDGYVVDAVMTAQEAFEYHRHQVGVFAEAGCDLVSGCTFAYPEEAIGLAQAAQFHGMPGVVYFTVETDGLLPDGSTLEDAITLVDESTDGTLAYFGINCAHPDHIAPALERNGTWVSRIRALRANASRRSHAELDEAEGLDDGDPAELAADYVRLCTLLPEVTVLGGCCGTDVRHLEQIASAMATS